MMTKLINTFNLITLYIFLFTNFLRAFILFNAYFLINRMPTFKDGIAHPKSILFSWQIDEIILLIGHFCNPVLIILSILLMIFGGKWRTSKQISTISFFIFLFALEVWFRLLTVYDYIIFD